jgi:iron complex transport system substrate-binding protein
MSIVIAKPLPGPKVAVIIPPGGMEPLGMVTFHLPSKDLPEQPAKMSSASGAPSKISFFKFLSFAALFYTRRLRRNDSSFLPKDRRSVQSRKRIGGTDRMSVMTRLYLRARCAAALSIAIIGFAGCGKEPRTYGGVLPDKVYGRIISLSPSLTELVGLLRATQFLVGRTASDNRPSIVRTVTIVANPRPDFEKIIKLQPDLILVDENLINPADLAKLEENKTYDIAKFRIDSIKDWNDAVWKLGALVQQYSAASEQVDKVAEAIRTAQASPLDPKPKVIVAMGGNKPWVAGTESFQADLVRSAGGEAIGPPGGKFVQVSPEQILAWNPDAAFVSDPPADYNGPAWSGTSAAKRGKIFQIDPDLLLRPGAQVQSIIAAISRELHNMEASN